MLESVDWRHYARDAQMVVLSGDPRIPIGELPQSTIRLAYLSVGEADPRRPYWSEVRGQPFLVEPNPELARQPAGSTSGTPRWQEVLLREEVAAPDAARVRRADARHRSTPPRTSRRRTRRGSRARARRCATGCGGCASAFPRAVVVANGSDALVDAAPYVDALRGRGRVRDLRRPAGERTGATTDAERDWKLARDRARAGGRAAAGVHDRVRRRRRRRAVAVGVRGVGSDTGFAPTSASAISTPLP